MSSAAVQPAAATPRVPSESVILRARGVGRYFRVGDSTINVLKNVDLSLRAGEFVAIEGRSGSGKSTLLHIMGGLDGVDVGSVQFEGADYTGLTFEARKKLWPRAFSLAYDAVGDVRDWLGNLRFRYQLLISLAIIVAFWSVLLIALRHAVVFKTAESYLLILPSPALPIVVLLGIQLGLWLTGLLITLWGRLSEFFLHPEVVRNERLASKLRNTQFGFVFQFYHLLPELDVVENTLLATHVQYSLFTFLLRRRALRARAVELLTQLGMGHRLTHRPNQLSGGERQRVAIARALMNNPRVLFADEPTGNLDADTGRQIMAVLEKLHRDQGQTIVMVTHDRALARTADRVLVLKDGRLEKAEA